MKPTDDTRRLIVDVNNARFLDDLLDLEKPVRHSATETLKKLRQMTWNQVYTDSGLKWEKIRDANPPPGIAALYSLRITQARRAIAYRDGDFMRFLSIPTDHDATYGKN